MRILQYITVVIIFIIGMGEVIGFVFNKLMEWLDKIEERESKK